MKGWLVGWCLTALSAQTGYIVPWEYETAVPVYCVGPHDKGQTHNNTMGQHDKPNVKRFSA